MGFLLLNTLTKMIVKSWEEEQGMWMCSSLPKNDVSISDYMGIRKILYITSDI